MTLDELTLSNGWELEALVGVLAEKGVTTKRKVYALMVLRRRNPGAAVPENSLAVDPHKANILIRDILDAFNSTGLTAQQAKDDSYTFRSSLKSASMSRTTGIWAPSQAVHLRAALW